MTTLWGLYATYGLLCGIGTGIVYIGIIGLMVKWFPERRGFATGVVAAGYGFGAILTTFPIDDMMKASGYQQHAVRVRHHLRDRRPDRRACSARAPREGEVVDRRCSRARWRSAATTPMEMLKTPVFWLHVRHDVDDVDGRPDGDHPVQELCASRSASTAGRRSSILGVTMAAIPAALTFDRITNGLTRPFFGWVSDHIGRENTMAIAFILEGIAIYLMLQYRTDPFLLIVLSGLVFFGWGEIFSLFPSTLTDTFGTKYATTNYGFLYMAQGVGSILGAPVAAMIFEETGSWMPVFYTIITLDILTGLLAVLVLKGMRRRFLAGEH